MICLGVLDRAVFHLVAAIGVARDSGSSRHAPDARTKGQKATEEALSNARMLLEGGLQGCGGGSRRVFRGSGDWGLAARRGHPGVADTCGGEKDEWQLKRDSTVDGPSTWP